MQGTGCVTGAASMAGAARGQAPRGGGKKRQPPPERPPEEEEEASSEGSSSEEEAEEEEEELTLDEHGRVACDGNALLDFRARVFPAALKTDATVLAALLADARGASACAGLGLGLGQHAAENPAPPTRVSVSSSVGGEQRSVATPQAARGWARPPCRHNMIHSC